MSWIFVLTAWLGVLSQGLPALRAQGAASPRKTVVVLHSTPPEIPGIHEANLAIRARLQGGSPTPVDIYEEYTGLDRFEGPGFEASLVKLYLEKYRSRKVDLLIAVGPSALDFIVSRRLMEDVPVVACYVAEKFVAAARSRRPEVTGAIPARNAPQTVELMLSMYPKTRKIEVILGSTPYERDQARAGRTMFRDQEQRVAFDYLNDLSLEALETRLGSLPDDALVLFGSFMRDAAGREFFTNDVLGRLSRASRRPVFGVVGEDMGEGLLGGILLSMELSGTASAELALRILAGERASAIPFVRDTGAAPIFDQRELDRWDIKARNLPPGSQVRYQMPSVWDAYWKEIGGAALLLAAETALVAGLIAQLRQRRKAEVGLKEAEMRYRTVADFTHDWEFWRRPDGGLEYVSPACEEVSGYRPEALKADPALLERIVFEGDLSAWREAQGRAMEGLPVPPFAYRIVTRAGGTVWVEQTSNPVRLEGGQLAGSRGSLRDITARKQSELELRKAYEEIAALKDQLEAENTYYRDKIQAVEGSGEILGQSDAMKYLLFRITQVAPSGTTVLIQGDTGTGKELVAEAIHAKGPRADRPLVKINCAALPPGLAESELFGHEKGAFTGAVAQRKGRFEVADGATLFLDEVGELSPEIQAKLLRVLQDGEFQRVGGTRTIKVDVRIIAATNRDLAREVAAGRFREDLWYRLNVFPITLPPLAQRKDDIPILAETFLQRLCQRLGRPPMALPKAVVQALQAYPWPGNVRELQNVIEQAVLVSEGETLRLAEALTVSRRDAAQGEGPFGTLEEVERGHIFRVLEATRWKLEGQKGAAEILGLKPSTLRSRMQKLEIARTETRTPRYA